MHLSSADRCVSTVIDRKKNETLIQTALSRLIHNKTVLIIAHRMRTVAGADKIVVLSNGVVAEQSES